MDYKSELHDRAEAAYKMNIAPENPDARKRLDFELEQFDKRDWYEPFYLLYILTRKCRAIGHRCSTGMDGSFLAYLLGMTRFDPLPGDGFGLSVPWDAHSPFWIRVGETVRQEQVQTLMRFTNGDYRDSEMLPGLAFILHPSDNSGTEFRILSSYLYTLMDEVQQSVGAPHGEQIFALPGYIPGLFTPMEEYEILHTEIKSMDDLTDFLQELKQFRRERALYLADDILDVARFYRENPEQWTAAFLNQPYYNSYFIPATMAEGLEVCRSAMRKMQSRPFFAGFMHAGGEQSVYRACEAAYLQGIRFLPAVPSSQTGHAVFSAAEPGIIRYPLKERSLNDEM